MSKKFKLVDVKFVDMIHFQMYEGKFQDLEQLETHNNEIYVYANVSNFETETYEESEVRVYAHPYEDLCCAEDYELREFYSPLKTEVLEYFKKEIIKGGISDEK